MWKWFLKWFRKKDSEPTEGATIYDNLFTQLGDLDELTKKEFSVRKARMVSIRVASSDLEDLSDRLIDAAAVVSDQGYFSDQWKYPVTFRTVGFESFISDANHLIHPLDWVREHRHHILKLLDSFGKLDKADSPYYQRKCNFVIEDILAVMVASRGCLR